MAERPAASAHAGEGRLHALDALRAAMMFLGVVLHASASYLDHCAPAAWGYCDADRSLIFDVLAYLIHNFRMPVFFLLAGFFSALMVAQRGLLRFSLNRAQRVLLPLALFVLPLWVADALAPGLARGGLEGAVGAWRELSLPADLAVLGHLWFLHYLLLFYGFYGLVLVIGRRLLSAGQARQLGGWLGARWAPLIPAVPLAPVLFTQPYAVLNTSSTPVPELASLLFYGALFLLGAWLWLRRDQLERLRAHATRFLLLGGAWVVADLLLLLLQTESGTNANLSAPARSDLLQGLVALGSALATCFLAFGLVGAALRWCARPSAALRYAADASYWVYLMHNCVVLYFTALLSTWRAPAELKASVVIGAATLLGIVSYHLCVRSTLLGVLLNGKRHPFVLPWRGSPAPTP